MPESERKSERSLRGLGEAVCELREQRDWDPSKLASELGVEGAYVLALEAGELDPDYELLLALARALGVRPAALIGRAEDLAREG